MSRLPLLLLIAFAGCVVHPGVTHDPAPSPPPYEPGPVVHVPTPPPAHLATPPTGHPPHGRRRRPRPPRFDPASLFTPSAPYVGGGVLKVERWDVGGGNLFKPKAKIGVRVRAASAHRIGLYGLGATHVKIFEERSTRNGAYVFFEHRYGRGSVKAFEVVLYNSTGRIVAVVRRGA